MSQYKSEDYKICAVNYYLVGDKTQKEVIYLNVPNEV